MQRRLEAAEEYKAKGNDFYKEKQYDQALEQYSKALDTASRTAQECAVYQANSAACHLALQQHRQCIECCNSALELDATYQKALLRRMAAFEALDELENALHDAQLVCPASCCFSVIMPIMFFDAISLLLPTDMSSGARWADE